jgi:four helix bundle protein
MQRIPRDEAARIIGRQMLRSTTSVGANYRAACRARTNREFVSKIRLVCEEADESQYWSELLLDAQLGPPSLLTPFHKEATELTAMFTKALDTARRKLKKRP